MIDGIPIRPEPQVDTVGHLSLGTASEIAKNPERAIGAVDALPPREEMTAGDGAFIATLDAAGVPDAVVQGTRAWLEAGGSRTDMPNDAADAQSGMAELQQVWGADKTEAKLKQLGDYMRTLPADEADFLAFARDPVTGKRYSNDPAHIQRFLALASAPRPMEMTIVGLEQFMRTNRKAWMADSALQARYRELIDQRESAKGT